MKHGDILIRTNLSGEPKKLTIYWRGSFPAETPLSASLAIVRPPPQRMRMLWDWYDPSLHFEALSRTEMKRADLSISEASTSMEPEEIAVARELTVAFFNWLSGRTSVPNFDAPMNKARMSLVLEGNRSEEIITALESFGDLEVIRAIQVGVVYLQGEPRRPDVRWLTGLTVVETFERSLAEGQKERFIALSTRIEQIFRKRLAMRRAIVSKRISGLFGYGHDLRIGDQIITDRDLETHFPAVLALLDSEERKLKKTKSGQNRKR